MDKIKHVAIIMDGNGRWANSRSHARVWGHVRGSGVVSSIIEKADDLKIKYLTLYAFSNENWCRPAAEVKILFRLLKKYIIKERARILKNNIQFRMMGDLSGLPEQTVDLINSLVYDSQNNTGLILTFAFGYSGRVEIVDAVNQLLKNHPDKRLISEKDIRDNLYHPDIKEVDLLIRTGGDQRVSNYLLWQIAYSELFFTPTKWPDFTPKEFEEIIDLVEKRQRRFGSVGNSKNLDDSLFQAHEHKNHFMSQN